MPVSLYIVWSPDSGPRRGKKDEPVTKEQKTRSINAGYPYWPVDVICQYYTWTPAPRRVFYDSRAAVIDMQIQR